MKISKGLWLLALLLIVGLCLCACTGTQEEPTEAPTDAVEATEEAEEGGAPALNADTVLYYNIHREQYDGLAEDALTARPKDLTDGYFHIQLATDGQIVELLAKSRILTNKVDTNSILTFTFKEDGVIDEAYSIEELGGTMAASHCFVTTVEGNVVTLNTNNTNSGDEFTITLAEGAAVYDLSDEESNYGAITELAEMDELVAVADGSGNVTHVWVLSRAAQRMGRGGCICGAGENGEHKEGCDGTMLFYWQPWTNENALPSESGYWYLDVPDKTIDVLEFIKLNYNADIYIDLNGHTVNGHKGGNGLFFCPESSVNVNVTILDSVGGATVKLNAKEGEEVGSMQGGFAVYTGEKHCFTIYGGTIDARGADFVGGNGCIFRVINGAILNIHGGTIIGSESKGNTGGLIFCSGTLNITGGTLKGGFAKKGGNLFIGNYDKNGVTMYGTLNMTGGEVIDGKAEICGGNLCYYEDGGINITGGTVSGGEAPEDPDIYMYPKFDPAA